MSRHHRRVLTGFTAVGQGLLGVALIALAALVFLPDAHATPPSPAAAGAKAR